MQTIPKKEGKGVTLYELVYIMSVAALVTSGRKRRFYLSDQHFGL